MTDLPSKSALLSALDHILIEGAPDARFGLCYNLSRLVSEAGEGPEHSWSAEFVSELAEGWPGHSGDDRYPVPHPDRDPYTAYYTGDLWTGEYGERRIELTRWVRDRLAEREED